MAVPRAVAKSRTERLLQINLAVLTALGTLLLGMGERNVTLPVLAIIVAVSSVYLTDIKGWLQLNTFVANVAGLIALAVTWREWNTYAAEGQLLSLANLLIYLQFVLLYRKKTVRNYWLLLLLSLLQVAVAAALNMSVSFGVLLPAYMFFGLLTMSLFVLYRAQIECVEAAGDRPLPVAAPRSPGEAPRRWPLAQRRPSFKAVETLAVSGSGLGWSFYREMIWLGTATCALALIWFFGLPRPGKKGPWRPSGVVPYTSVGFSESVTLDQLGEVYENPEEVMQVTFHEMGSSESYRVGGDSALFRGSVLYYYDRGRWKPQPRNASPYRLRLTPEGQLPTDRQLVRESVKIQGRSDAVLFSVVPAFTVATKGLNYAPDSEQLLRTSNPTEKFKYELVTSAFRDHIPVTAFPAEGPPGDAARDMPRERNGSDPLEGVRAEAAEFAGSDASPERIARNLESHLRDGYFQYSLKQTRRSLGVDPVEAFVTEHRSGHCEYFASALVLMLRSVGIPARLAIGFKGGEWNMMGRFYQIRELHAHAWVEAYMEKDQLPASLVGNRQAQANGAWLILDPTPGRSEEELADTFGMGALKRMLDFTQLMWTNYVLGMDSQRQQEAIYQPLVERLEDALQSFTNEEARQRLRDWLVELLGQRLGLSNGLLSWQGVVAALTVCLLLIGVWKTARAASVRVRGWLVRRASDKQRAARRVEFYEQLESLLTRYGLPRTANQTQREFALATGGYLAESPLTQQAAGLPRRIVDAYYGVRFGLRELDNHELRSVEKALSELAAALAERHAATGAHNGSRKL